ncbi:TolC family protein [Nostoc sp. CHAB 5834]|nr:TolC family protein [Nostoc sp. CHAB 5834]
MASPPTGCLPQPPESALSLPSALERALCQNTELSSAYLELKAANVAAAQAQAASGPQLDGSLSSTIQDGQAAGTATSAKLNLSYLLFDFGQQKNSIEALRAQALAAHFAANSVAQDILYGGATKFIQAVDAAEKEGVLKERLTAAKQSLAVANARFALGKTTRHDVYVAQAAAHKAELAVLQAQAEAVATTADLARHLGDPADTRYQFDKLPSPTPELLEESAALLQRAEQFHPSIRKARALLDASGKSEEGVKASTLPKFTISASHSRAGSGLRDSGTSVGLTMTVPLFDNGLRDAQKHSARLKVESAQTNLEAARLTTLTALVKADAQVRVSYASFEAANSYLDAAREGERLASGRYSEGVGTLQDWLQAQADLADAKQQHVSQSNAWHLAKMRLSQATGNFQLSYNNNDSQ